MKTGQEEINNEIKTAVKEQIKIEIEEIKVSQSKIEEKVERVEERVEKV